MGNSRHLPSAVSSSRLRFEYHKGRSDRGGKEVNGLQAGSRFGPCALTLEPRNVGKEPIDYSYATTSWTQGDQYHTKGRPSSSHRFTPNHERTARYRRPE